MKHITSHLKQRSQNGLLSSECLEETRVRFDISHADTERLALEAVLLPSRYQRNGRTITPEQQLKLFMSRVAVVGCGGLGGYIIEGLARLGVGQIVAIDPDRFEDHNLNRQLFSKMSLIGHSKALAAARRIAEINPAVTVTPAQIAFTRENANELFAGVDVIADAVDSIATRLELGEACNDLKIPLVHAAIAGWYGHVCTIFPGDDTLRKIYQNHNGAKGIEQEMGNPAFTPAVMAGFEVAEICKIIIGNKNLLRNRILTIDLLDMETEQVTL
ncbi:MAG: HesA/MoeB/ThiF family protein [Desulfuromonadales bacterium]|nr:HesA/MoeB/ThiF family protein [Desulfuromonadales bacterium]